MAKNKFIKPAQFIFLSIDRIYTVIFSFVKQSSINFFKINFSNTLNMSKGGDFE